jgi:hypothetical protein
LLAEVKRRHARSRALGASTMKSCGSARCGRAHAGSAVGWRLLAMFGPSAPPACCGGGLALPPVIPVVLALVRA